MSPSNYGFRGDVAEGAREPHRRAVGHYGRLEPVSYRGQAITLRMADAVRPCVHGAIIAGWAEDTRDWRWVGKPPALRAGRRARRPRSFQPAGCPNSLTGRVVGRRRRLRAATSLGRR